MRNCRPSCLGLFKRWDHSEGSNIDDNYKIAIRNMSTITITTTTTRITTTTIIENNGNQKRQSNAYGKMHRECGVSRSAFCSVRPESRSGPARGRAAGRGEHRAGAVAVAAGATGRGAAADGDGPRCALPLPPSLSELQRAQILRCHCPLDCRCGVLASIKQIALTGCSRSTLLYLFTFEK